MKFGKYLESSMVIEWQPKYFQYKLAKKKVKALGARIEQAYASGVDVRLVKDECNREFEEYLKDQMQTIRSFYQSQLSKFSTTLESLEASTRKAGRVGKVKRKSASVSDTDPLLSDNVGETPMLPAWKRQFTRSLKNVFHEDPEIPTIIKKGDFRELYSGMFALKNFGILNNQAFHKIGKKYEKTLFVLACENENGVKSRSREWSEEWINQNVKKENFYTHYDIEELIYKLEQVVARIFYRGNRSTAIAKLRPKKDRTAVIPYVWAGFSLGVSGVLLLMVSRLLYGDTKSGIANGRMHGFYLPLYRLFFMPIVMIWGGMLNMFVWERYKVNYRFIMELDTRNDYRWYNLASFAGLVSIIVTSCLYCTVAGAADEIHLPIRPWWLFIVAFTSVLLICVNPIRMHMRYGRWVAAKVLWRILSAPCHPVGFIDFFIADQFVSLVKGFSGATITLCTLFSHPNRKWSEVDSWCEDANQFVGPFVSLLPLWFRLAQCLRRYVQSGYTLKTQAVNAGKYAASMLAVIVAASGALCTGEGACSTTMLSLNVGVHLFATLYSTAWDMKMDWGILQSEGFPLRKRLIYPRWWYYVAAVVNVVLRFMWAVSLTVEKTSGWPSKEAGLMGMAFLEMYRRIQWNIFRVENEQVNNLENYRAFKDVVVPTYSEDSDDELVVHTTSRGSSRVNPEGLILEDPGAPSSPMGDFRLRKSSAGSDYRKLSDLDL